MDRRLSFLILAIFSTTADAYEVDTHALITSAAFERSALKDSALLERTGLSSLNLETPQPGIFDTPSGISESGDRDGYFDLPAEMWSASFAPNLRRRVVEYDWRNMQSDPEVLFRTNPVHQECLKAWLMRGAIREDDVPIAYYPAGPKPDPDPHGPLFRVFHHFFDPINDQALYDAATCFLLPDNAFPCIRNADWAFGRPGVTSDDNAPVDPSRRNHFTWADAREALWCALTRNADGLPTEAAVARSATERRFCWSTGIKSLGHVLHLVQDAAQPQHSRVDPHNPAPDFDSTELSGTSFERRTYEVWTNCRATGGSVGGEISVEEPEASEFRDFFRNSGITPTALNAKSNYQVPRFSEPQHYFSTRQIEAAITPASVKKRRGLADLSNRGFFSEGTILSPDFPLPPADAQSSEYTIKERIIGQCEGFGALIERNLSMSLVDPLKGNYVDAALAPFGDKIPLTTLSMWHEYAAGDPEVIKGVISLDQYTAHADVLIPRAIAYSAGLIDYFFRGKLEITPPLDGLFSVIDHGTPHTVNANGYPIRSDDSKVFGFTRMRLRVRNATEVVNESGTTLPIPRDMLSTTASAAPLQGDPTLVAVARYHRNPCYKPDLSGEKRIAFDGAITEAAGCGAAGTRTPFQEISVSRPVASSAAALNGAGQDLVFDFASQPIPVNATDLAIQVVYRGPLGLEGDAIAVGAFDIREPTYLTHWNNSDYAACNGAWAAHGATPPGCIVEGGGAQRAIFTTRLCIGTQMVFEHLDNPHGSLGTGSFVRLAALLDDKQKPTRSRSIVHNLSSAEIRNRTIVGQVRQSAKEQVTAQAPFVSEPMWKKRGFVGSSRPLPYYQINGADLQPASDTGPMDVGALTNPIAVAAAPDPGNIVFPDVALSSMACTVQDGKAMFADEVAYEPGRPH